VSFSRVVIQITGGARSRTYLPSNPNLGSQEKCQMKRSARVSLSTLVIVLLLLIVPAAYGQTVSGGFSTTTDEGSSKFELNANVYANGTASGEILFEGPLAIPDQDVDGDGSGDKVGEKSLSLRIDVQCGQVEGNRATIGGVVRDSNVGDYIGRGMLLTVEDGEKADAFTWGQYRPTAPTWLASDGELERDPGVGMTWFATDFERKDDAGIPAGGVPANVDCRSFPLGSYELEELAQGAGDIQVKQ